MAIYIYIYIYTHPLLDTEEKQYTSHCFFRRFPCRTTTTHIAVRPLKVVVHVGYQCSIRPQEVIQFRVGEVRLRHSFDRAITEEIKERLDVAWIVSVAVVICHPGIVESGVLFQSPQVPQPSPSRIMRGRKNRAWFESLLQDSKFSN